MPLLNFKGKTFVQNHHLAVPYHQLIPKKGKSLTDKVSLKDNLIVHGDNLLALKALLPTYAGKVKCIYIDPPYNTGNEGWVYNDNVNSPLMKEWIGKVVGKKGEDLVRHDKWLCMMMPRLKLLRELLSPDGVIFISIDENELHHLLNLMNEVFNETNFVATLVWRKRRGGGNDSSHVAVDHEYVVVYSNNKDKQGKWRVKYEKKYLKRYNEEDDLGRYYWDTLSRPGLNNPIVYDLKTPDGSVIKEGKWQVSEETFLQRLEAGRIRFEKNGDGSWTVFHKVYKPDGKVLRSIISDSGLGVVDDTTNKDAGDELEEIFGNKKEFNNPKPTELIRKFVDLVTEDNSIVLDSFAGSGTTAQAVLTQNVMYEGRRKFILVEMEDYADTITAERVRRVIKGVPKAKNELVKKGLGGSFSYFELGDAIEMESLLSGKSLPKYAELARYLYYTATGEEFKPGKVDEASHFIGSNDDYKVFVYYKPDIEYLKTTALTLDEARKLRKRSGNKPLLVFAPTKYVEQQMLDELKITFCQLPFEIYRMKK